MNINISDDILRVSSYKPLGRLLTDKTTKKNILWATDAYALSGDDYSRGKEIMQALITGVNADVIKTRARKAMEQQSERTKQHGVLFTIPQVAKASVLAVTVECDNDLIGYKEFVLTEII